MSLRYVLIDGCPVPRLLAGKVRALKRDVPGAVLLSCYRGEGARRLLHRNGKHTQAELYSGWVRHLAGYNPANPPGRSTHELRSDGAAYDVPVGKRLPYWCVGMDWPDNCIPALKLAAQRRGWRLFQPYTSGSEYHHLNFARKPR